MQVEVGLLGHCFSSSHAARIGPSLLQASCSTLLPALWAAATRSRWTFFGCWLLGSAVVASQAGEMICLFHPNNLNIIMAFLARG
jgi:hypothetical protein